MRLSHHAPSHRHDTAGAARDRCRIRGCPERAWAPSPDGGPSPHCEGSAHQPVGRPDMATDVLTRSMRCGGRTLGLLGAAVAAYAMLLRRQSHTPRAGGAGARPRLAGRERKLGLELRVDRARRRHEADQPQPLSAPPIDRPYRHDSDGAGVTGDGAQDAARHQAASREPCGRRTRTTLISPCRRGPDQWSARTGSAGCPGWRAPETSRCCAHIQPS